MTADSATTQGTATRAVGPLQLVLRGPRLVRHLTHHGMWQRTPPWVGGQRREVRLHVDDAVRDLEALMIHVCMGSVRGLANISQPAFVGTARPWKQVPAGEFEWFLSRH